MTSNNNKDDEYVNDLEEESFSIEKMITYFLIACTLIIGVLTFFVFVDGISVKQAQKISTYIASADELLKESEQLTQSLYLYATGESNHISMEEEVLVTLRQLISEERTLAVPDQFQHHQKIVKDIVIERYTVAYLYLLGDRSKQTAEAKFAEIDKLIDKEHSSLITALEETDLQYEVLEDGSIRFFYKTY